MLKKFWSEINFKMTICNDYFEIFWFDMLRVERGKPEFKVWYVCTNEVLPHP